MEVRQLHPAAGRRRADPAVHLLARVGEEVVHRPDQAGRPDRRRVGGCLLVGPPTGWVPRPSCPAGRGARSVIGVGSSRCVERPVRSASTGGTPDVTAVAAMADAMAPRGPDARGRLVAGPGRTRSSPAQDHRPVRGGRPADGRLRARAGDRLERLHLQLPELRDELIADGYRFFSHSDTEVLLKAYHRWGDRLRRPPHGHVRLRHRRTRQRPAGAGPRPARHQAALPRRGRASDPVRVLACPPCWPAATSTLASIPSPCTTTCASTRSCRRRGPSCAGIRKLPPATLIALEPDGRRTTTTYWAPDFTRHDDRADWSERDWEEAVLDAAATRGRAPPGRRRPSGLPAVRRHRLQPDRRPAGRGRPARPADVQHRLRIGGRGRRRRVPVLRPHRRALRHRPPPDPDRHRALLPALDGAIGAMSEPMVSHDCVAFYLLSEEVAKHVKVVQSGQGADEVFAGYHWYPPMGTPPPRRSTARSTPTARAFFDRDPAGVEALLSRRHARARRPQRAVRHRALRPAGRRNRRRPRRCASTPRSCWSTTRSSGSTT